MVKRVKAGVRWTWSRAWDRLVAPDFLVQAPKGSRRQRLGDAIDGVLCGVAERFPQSWFDQND